jgi:high-affinity Fe2+/Pb2+ permease
MAPENDPPQKRRENFLGLMLALFFGAGFFLFLVLVTGGFFLYVLGAVVVMGVVGYFHYMFWGHSLTHQVAGEREEEEARERWESEHTPVPSTPRDPSP